MLQADRKRRWAIFPWMCALSALSTVAFAQVPEDARDWIALAIERVCDDPSKDGLAVQNAMPAQLVAGRHKATADRTSRPDLDAFCAA